MNCPTSEGPGREDIVVEVVDVATIIGVEGCRVENVAKADVETCGLVVVTPSVLIGVGEIKKDDTEGSGDDVGLGGGGGNGDDIDVSGNVEGGEGGVEGTENGAEVERAGSEVEGGGGMFKLLLVVMEELLCVKPFAVVVVADGG